MIKENFYKFSKELLSIGISYVSLILLDEKNNAVFNQSTNEKWQEYYIKNELYYQCHIIRQVLKTYEFNQRNFTFLWDCCHPDNEESLFLQRKRIENKISHGVAFCSMTPDFNKQILTVASIESDINFSLKIIENKNLIYKEAMKSILTK